MKTSTEYYNKLAEAELERADDWANDERLSKEVRDRFVNRALTRAQIYATLAVAQEIHFHLR